jgi:ABC-type transporter Mla subunit MlaD
MTNEQHFRKIDERLDAIARNLELLSAMHLKTEENLDRLTQNLDQLTLTVDRAMGQVASILQNHEGRIDRLEGN